jgi:predicted transcriptional regulator
MENTIMTEKIARRGVKTPDSYEPDILEKISVRQAISHDGIIISEENTISEVREWLDKETDYRSNYFIISSQVGEYKGILSSSSLYSRHHKESNPVISLVKRHDIYIAEEHSLRYAVEKMAKENVDVLPVIAGENKNIIGVLSYHDIIDSYRYSFDEHERKAPKLSVKQLKVLVRGQKLKNIIFKK